MLIRITTLLVTLLGVFLSGEVASSNQTYRYDGVCNTTVHVDEYYFAIQYGYAVDFSLRFSPKVIEVVRQKLEKGFFRLNVTKKAGYYIPDAPLAK